jgi:hypothetical protein
MFVENIERCALVVRPKQPFKDWIKSHDPEFDLSQVEFEGDVYLLSDFKVIGEIKNWLRENFDVIFSEQLNSWYVDESMWVSNRTLKMFAEWFDYSLHTMVWDVEEE